MNILSLWSAAWVVVSVFVIVAGSITALIGVHRPSLGLVLIGVAALSAVMQTYLAVEKEKIAAIRGEGR